MVGQLLKLEMAVQVQADSIEVKTRIKAIRKGFEA